MKTFLIFSLLFTSLSFGQIQLSPAPINDSLTLTSSNLQMKLINKGNDPITPNLTISSKFSIGINRCNQSLAKNRDCSFRISIIPSMLEDGDNFGELFNNGIKISDLQYYKTPIAPVGAEFQSTSYSISNFNQQSITVMNKSATSQIFEPTFSGANADLFEITINRCNTLIAPNRTCSISYKLKPVPNGTYSATLSSSNIINQLSINANITTSTIQPEPIDPILVSDLSLVDFGNITKYGATSSRKIIITNIGTKSYLPYLEKTANISYSFNRCTSWLSAGASCEIQFRLNVPVNTPNGVFSSESITIKNSATSPLAFIVNTTANININSSLTYDYVIGEYSPTLASVQGCQGQVSSSRTVTCFGFSGVIPVSPAIPQSLCTQSRPSENTTFLSPNNFGSPVAFSNLIGSGVAECEEGGTIDDLSSVLTYDQCSLGYSLVNNQCIKQFELSIGGFPDLVLITGSSPGSYPENEVVQLTIENSDPYGEVSWGGDCSSFNFDEVCELTMDSDKFVEVNKTCVNGSIEVNGICLPEYNLSAVQPILSSILLNPLAGIYVEGTEVSAEYNPVANSEFMWSSGPCLGTSDINCNFTLSEDTVLSVSVSCSNGYIEENGACVAIPLQFDISPSFIDIFSTTLAIAPTEAGPVAINQTEPIIVVNKGNISPHTLNALAPILSPIASTNDASSLAETNFSIINAYSTGTQIISGQAEDFVTSCILSGIVSTSKPCDTFSNMEFSVSINKSVDISPTAENLTLSVNNSPKSIPIYRKGLSQVSNIRAGATDSPTFLTTLGDDLYFGAIINGSNHRKLFRYSKENNTLKQISNTFSGSDEVNLLTAHDGSIFFESQIPGSGAKKLFRYTPPSSGVTENLRIVTDTRESSFGDSFSSMISLGNRLYFYSLNPSGYYKLYEYDSGSVKQVTNINSSNNDFNGSFFRANNGTIYMRAESPRPESNDRKVYKYNPATSELIQISDFNNSPSTGYSDIDLDVKFVELRKMNLSGTGLETDGDIFFAGSIGATPNKLMKYNPQTNQITQVTNNMGSNADFPLDLTPLNGKLYLSLRTSTGFRQLHEYDPNTEILRRIYFSGLTSGSSDQVENLTVFKDKLYFTAYKSYSGSARTKLFEYDPSSDTITQITNLRSDFGDNILNLKAGNKYLYFTGSLAGGSNKLFKYSPENKEVIQISNLKSQSADDQISSLVFTNNTLYFVGASVNNIFKVFMYEEE